jgi:SAM-dependent methyltransferase
MPLYASVLILIGLFLFARWFAGFGTGAPYLPVRRFDIEDAFELAPVGPQDVVVDLGCGDGRILEEAAKRGASVIGYELNPFLVWYSRHRLRRFGDRVRIYRRNLLTADLSSATVVMIFQLDKIMPRIVAMLKRNARSDVRIISFAFDAIGLKEVAQKRIVKSYRLG